MVRVGWAGREDIRGGVRVTGDKEGKNICRGCGKGGVAGEGGGGGRLELALGIYWDI